MLFDIKEEYFKSVKERNLYAKFFAGYFFNDLITGYEQRINNFIELLNNDEKVINKSFLENKSEKGNIEIDPSSTHMSFDNHSFYVVDDKEADRGEFADILLHDKDNNVMISIEAKYLSNWKFDEDIKLNRKRLKKVAEKLNNDFYHCILIKNSKKQRTKNRKNSHYKKTSEMDLDYPVILLTWEDIVKICEGSKEDQEKIKSYMDYMLEKEKPEDFNYKRG